MQLLPKGVISHRHSVFMENMMHIMQQWDACPDMRPHLEKVMAQRLADRASGQGAAGEGQRAAGRQRGRPSEAHLWPGCPP